MEGQSDLPALSVLINKAGRGRIHMKEIWKDINGYKGLYQVSSKGRIKRIYPKEKILKQHLNNSGYKRITLCKNSKVKVFSVHRLVAQTFIPNPMQKPTVNHIDCDKTNNTTLNLEWLTRSEQELWKYKCGYINVKSKKVMCLETSQIFDSLRKCDEYFNVHYGSTYDSIKSNYALKKKYHFIYIVKK